MLYLWLKICELFSLATAGPLSNFPHSDTGQGHFLNPDFWLDTDDSGTVGKQPYCNCSVHTLGTLWCSCLHTIIQLKCWLFNVCFYWSFSNCSKVNNLYIVWVCTNWKRSIWGNRRSSHSEFFTDVLTLCGSDYLSRKILISPPGWDLLTTLQAM